ncbi:MAG: glycoside hydrolase family 3 protein, partial [Chloroflexi bacterium]
MLRRLTEPCGAFLFGGAMIRLVICCGLFLAMIGGTPDSSAAPDPIRARLETMTLEEKVGQLFLITLYSPELGPMDRALIEAIHPGGVVLFPHNIQSPEQVARLTNDLQAYAQEVGPDVPLLIAVDQEGGRVSRLLDGFTPFPSPLVLGATGRREDAVALGLAMGQELVAVGINMDLAPVADLHYPAHDAGEWEVMYRRTLSADPALVSTLAGGMVEGLRAAGVIAVLKHFPGHGAAQTDSHSELPVIPLTREETEATTLAA